MHSTNQIPGIWSWSWSSFERESKTHLWQTETEIYKMKNFKRELIHWFWTYWHSTFFSLTASSPSCILCSSAANLLSLCSWLSWPNNLLVIPFREKTRTVYRHTQTHRDTFKSSTVQICVYHMSTGVFIKLDHKSAFSLDLSMLHTVCVTMHNVLYTCMT